MEAKRGTMYRAPTWGKADPSAPVGMTIGGGRRECGLKSAPIGSGRVGQGWQRHRPPGLWGFHFLFSRTVFRGMTMFAPCFAV